MLRTNRRGLWGVFALVVVTAGSLGAWSVSQAIASGAEATRNGHAARAASRLEALHQRAVTRTKADEDDESERPSWGAGISPERAAELAQLHVQARGGATKHHTIESRSRNDRPGYEVQVGHHTVHVDAETEKVSD